MIGDHLSAPTISAGAVLAKELSGVMTALSLSVAQVFIEVAHMAVSSRGRLAFGELLRA